jgi:sacsin
MEAKESVAKATADTQCQICLINQVNVCLVPCGHTICEGCERQMHSNKCPFCRRGIQQRTKFFSPGGDSGGDEATL